MRDLGDDVACRLHLVGDALQCLAGLAYETHAVFHLAGGAGDLVLDLLGSRGGALGEFADLLGDDGEALAGFTGAGRFDTGLDFTLRLISEMGATS